MVSKMVVAVGTDDAEGLLACALETSRRNDAKVFMVHVVDPLSCLAGAIDFDCSLVMDAMLAQGRQLAATTEEWFNARGCAVQSELLVVPTHGASCGEAIASYANRQQVDLVLLGSRKSDWMQWLREDVAAVVMRNTSASVRRIPGAASKDLGVGSAPHPISASGVSSA
ncbi:universal stress protein [Paraburkholderia strydomiana]|uniref:universal stress protein n=1 Tax=Paraburkholderia strydomiana TaxID=1245417 RepID=UPI00285E85FE|nr:universal stress protein [Paraburkholderia strydomiana]MDR7006174.1 nucleotide-binding universal stress UspA family protein [Paraburkholderia strydomiana]